MPIPATVEPTYGITFVEWLWLGGTLFCIVLALYVVLEFIKIARSKWRKV